MGKTGYDLTNAEWLVMEQLWTQAPMTLMQLVRVMEAGPPGWAKSTTNTVVRRMEAKGLLRYEDGERARLYYPVPMRDEVARRETESFLSRVYGGSLGLMVNTLVDSGGLTQEDVEELRQVLHRFEKE